MSGTMTCPRRMGEMGPWERTEGLDKWRPNDTCSFCGSLSPAKVFERLEAGQEMDPTDKNYKGYVGPDNQKFYFQHFSEEDQRRFIALHNSGAMKIGYPGYLYTRPFFVRVAP